MEIYKFSKTQSQCPLICDSILKGRKKLATRLSFSKKTINIYDGLRCISMRVVQVIAPLFISFLNIRDRINKTKYSVP